MIFEWTRHRFSGGALALDVANTVILRHDASRRIDRFADRQEIARFAKAARQYSAERANLGRLEPVGDNNIADFIGLRESIDHYYRHFGSTGSPPAASSLASLLEACAGIVRRHGDNTDGLPLDLATATSALSLIGLTEPRRLKICGNCEWLFMDRSKNLSRIWCDMAICGNRVKARQYYRKTREAAL